MIFAYKILILVVFITSLLACVNSSSVFHPDSEMSLLNYMARSNDLLKQDSEHSLKCFQEYVEAIKEIASNYELNFKSCLNESEHARVNADLDTLEKRKSLEESAQFTCELLQQCQGVKTVENELQCFVDGSSASLKLQYEININAAETLAALQREYYLIQNEEYKCTNESKRIYETESINAYAGLNDCILGKAYTVTETTTDEPKPTPNQPTEPTKEPQTSNVPLITTEAPETSDTKSEENTTENPV